ncbi:MAG: FG-GAP-like repeat-containing protein [Methyloglobulus sp.]
MYRSHLAFLIAVSINLLVLNPVQANIFTVGVGAGCTHSTLAEALSASAASLGTDQIRLSKTIQYHNIEAQIISQNIEIKGGYETCQSSDAIGSVSLEGDGGTPRSVLQIRGVGIVRLTQLTIAKGDGNDNSDGGGIDYKGSGALILDSVILDHNHAGNGGGIYFRGDGAGAKLTLLDNNYIQYNSAARSGGGIYLNGRAMMNMSGRNNVVAHNTAYGVTPVPNQPLIEGYGGGLFVQAPANAEIGSGADSNGSVFFQNEARIGGGIAVLGNNLGHANLVRLFSGYVNSPMRVSGNKANEKGGAIYVSATAVNSYFSRPGVCLLDTSLEGNSAPKGAAVFTEKATNASGSESPYFSINACPRPNNAPTCPTGSNCSHISGNVEMVIPGKPNTGSIIELDMVDKTHSQANRLNSFAAHGNAAGSLIKLNGGELSSTRIQNCLVWGNTISQFIVDAPEAATIINQCTIAANTINTISQYIFRLHQPSGFPQRLSKVTNSIIAQPRKQAVTLTGDLPLFEAAHVFSNAPFVNGIIQRYLTNQDPGFVNPSAFDFRLKPDSAAIDYAPLYGDGLATDVTGNKRTVDLPKTNLSGLRDVGAYEVQIPIQSIPKDLPVYINGSTTEWKELLKQTLAEGGRTVVLAFNVDMDLSGEEGLYIGPNTTLTSNNARTPNNLGPRLFTTTRPKPLFLIRCNGVDIFGDNVTVEGFRLIGPHFNSESGSSNEERGIMVESCRNVKVRNMEVAGWSGQAIYVSDSVNRITDDNAVQVSNNFIHHNQHDGGEGYGVESAHGARVIIEKNAFDFNRHAIMASGLNGPLDEANPNSPLNGTGYIARHNLVLRGGGYHGSYGPYTHYTQQFDVHGTTKCVSFDPFDWFSDSLCGQAGDTFEIANNAFQYTVGYAIKFRGNPTNYALVANNIFAHGNSSDAITQNGNAGPGDNITNPIQLAGNQYNFQSYGKYGVCDFDGDDIDDLFLATGVNWWYSSSGKAQWTFLKDATERLPQVGLGDFDGDGKCDVVAGGTPNPLQIASGGTGDWKVLTDMSGVPLVDPFNQLRFGDFNGDGRTDIFFRGNDGQWQIISPGYEGVLGIYDWTPIQSSGFPLSDLRFGDFNNDKITDVIAIQGGRWSVSWGGKSTWVQLNGSLSDSLKPVLIGDIDHNGFDDIIRYRVTASPPQIGDPPGLLYLNYILEVSWDGVSGWSNLQFIRLQSGFAPTVTPRLVGRFRKDNGHELLGLANTRKGKVFDVIGKQYSDHSLYAY